MKNNRKHAASATGRLSPALWGMAAAVLIFAALAGILIARSHPPREEEFTLPPMVYVGGIRYLFEQDITAEAPQLEPEFRPLGKIVSVIAETEYVYEELQANFPALGASVFRWEEYIVLFHEEKVWLMRPMADIQTETFPESRS